MATWLALASDGISIWRPKRSTQALVGSADYSKTDPDSFVSGSMHMTPTDGVLRSAHGVLSMVCSTGTVVRTSFPHTP